MLTTSVGKMLVEVFGGVTLIRILLMFYLKTSSLVISAVMVGVWFLYLETFRVLYELLTSFEFCPS